MPFLLVDKLIFVQHKYYAFINEDYFIVFIINIFFSGKKKIIIS